MEPGGLGEMGVFEGAPVFDGSVAQMVRVDVGRGDDARVMLGIGPAGGRPVAYLALCPCEGVDGLVADLVEVAAEAAPHHAAHADAYGSPRVDR